MCSRNRKSNPVAGAEESRACSRIGKKITEGLGGTVKKTRFCLCELEDPEEF